MKLINYFKNKWQLINLRPFVRSQFTNNYVALAYSLNYKIDVVLKVNFCESIKYEQKALEYYNGNGCAKLLDCDVENNGLLLEYINPGNSLKQLFFKEDSKAVEIAANVIIKLHSYQNPKISLNIFPKINNWLSLLNSYKSKVISKDLIEQAKVLSNVLLNTQGKTYLLHGDLHHENILKKDNTWIAIDPKGIVGELEYELGAFIRNPIPEFLESKDVNKIIKSRIEQFGDILNLNKERIKLWSFVQAVLAACWAEQDNYDPRYFIRFATLIEIL